MLNDINLNCKSFVNCAVKMQVFVVHKILIWRVGKNQTIILRAATPCISVEQNK